MTTAISDAIVTKLKQFMVEILRDESHSLIKKSVRQAKECVHFINEESNSPKMFLTSRSVVYIKFHTHSEGKYKGILASILACSCAYNYSSSSCKNRLAKAGDIVPTHISHKSDGENQEDAIPLTQSRSMLSIMTHYFFRTFWFPNLVSTH